MGISQLFDSGPPIGWKPSTGERVAALVSYSEAGFLFDYAVVKERLEAADPRGQAIVIYLVEYDGGGSAQLSRYNMRPITKGGA